MDKIKTPKSDSPEYDPWVDVWYSAARQRKIHTQPGMQALWYVCLVVAYLSAFYFVGTIQHAKEMMVPLITLLPADTSGSNLELIKGAMNLSVAVFFMATIASINVLMALPKWKIMPLVIKILFVLFVLTVNIPGIVLSSLLLYAYPKFLFVVINTPDPAEIEPPKTKTSPSQPSRGRTAFMRVLAYVFLVLGAGFVALCLWLFLN